MVPMSKRGFPTWSSESMRAPRELTQYRARTWTLTTLRWGAAALAVIMTLYSMLLAFFPDSNDVLVVIMWVTVSISLAVIVVISSIKTRLLRERTYRPDPGHSLTIRVDDFLGSMKAYPNANVAFGAHDTFDPEILHPNSLHALIFENYFASSESAAHGDYDSKVGAHDEAVTTSAGPLPLRGHYPYGTVAVLPIYKTDIRDLEESPGVVPDSARSKPLASDSYYQRRAYLIVNSTWGKHTFSSFGNVQAVTNPLSKIVEKHRIDHDVSACLLVALIGTGQSSSVSSMASLLTLIDEFFHQREIGRRNPFAFDPISNIVVSLRPSELQSGTVDLEVVHQYCAAKLKAFASR